MELAEVGIALAAEGDDLAIDQGEGQRSVVWLRGALHDGENAVGGDSVARLGHFAFEAGVEAGGADLFAGAVGGVSGCGR